LIFATVPEPLRLPDIIMKTSVSTAIFITVAFISCLPDSKYYNTGTFPENPVNMGEINSEFDDYNSASPVI